jgi:hypothetical protein
MFMEESNGYFGGAKARRSKVTTTVERHPGSYPCTKWFAFSRASHTDRQSKASQSQTNDVCRRQGEDFEVDERALVLKSHRYFRTRMG